MNNILKSNVTATTTWGHRKTIQSQAAEIETLRNKADALLKVTVDQGQKIEELNNQLEFKSICLSAALADLKRMDEKLLNAQDEFFNLGDKIMGLAPDPDRPFKKPEITGKTFMDDYLEKRPFTNEKQTLLTVCPDEAGYTIKDRHEACTGEYLEEICVPCWNQPLEAEKCETN